MYGTENNELELIVDRNGNINFPKLGNLSVAGMTFWGDKRIPYSPCSGANDWRER